MSHAVANPPSYEAAMAQLKQLQQQGVSDAAKKQAQIAVTEKVSEDDTEKDLLEEVKALAESAIAIDRSFQDVLVALGTVDNSGFVGQDGKPLPKLQPTWAEFQKEYTALLWSSRVTATQTEAYLMDFTEVCLPMINDAIDDPDDKNKFNDAVAELGVFIERTDPNEGIVDGGDASSHSQAFTDLRRKLDAFKDSFDDFAKFKEGEITAEMARIKGIIDVLTLEIKKCDDIVMAMGIALGVTVFATAAGAVGALAGLGPLGPAVAIGILIVGALAAIGELSTLIAYVVKGNEYRAELRVAEAQMKDLEDKLALLKRIQATLEGQKSTIGEIAARLDRFAAIWSMISHDAILVRSQFQSAAESGSLGGLKYRVNTLLKTYTPLTQALKIYATMVDESGVPKP